MNSRLTGPLLSRYCLDNRPAAADDVVEATFARVVLSNRVRADEAGATVGTELVVGLSKKIDAVVGPPGNLRELLLESVEVSTAQLHLHLVLRLEWRVP